MAGERFDWRKTLVVDEANAIGTAWLRTDLIPEPQAAQARRVLRAYTQARLDLAVLSMRAEAIGRSEKLQVELWGITRDAAAAAPTPTVALFVVAVNEVIDVHGMRVQAALRNPIPPTIFATLFAVSILVLAATGYAGGLTRDRSAIASILLAVVLAVVLTLIMDLDRPFEGLLTVSQQAMVDVLKSMGPARRADCLRPVLGSAAGGWAAPLLAAPSSGCWRTSWVNGVEVPRACRPGSRRPLREQLVVRRPPPAADGGGPKATRPCGRRGGRAGGASPAGPWTGTAAHPHPCGEAVGNASPSARAVAAGADPTRSGASGAAVGNGRCSGPV